MPSLLSIFISAISKLVTMGIEGDSPKQLPPELKAVEEMRREVKPPSPNDTNLQNSIRVEYSYELMRNADGADCVHAIEYMKEVDRIMGYHGAVQQKIREVKERCK